MILIPTITKKLVSACFTSFISLVPRPIPKPRIGPIRGEMSIAPMMTGMELRLSPTDAMIIAQARMKTLAPRKCMFFLMLSLADSTSKSSDILTIPLIY